ncbi:MAG: tRNA (guanosine(37)-N1)-methyltransferase TrmD [Candidatus Latescibacteria bacterium]|jgi:tRNA (guanine37-N1)-methyltransferase|nr:tRNA (guanosine(37)-N1)-methyltransferase TrmD [Candidatus Latescibacterota bacterium]
MRFDILTAFPDMFTGPFNESIIKRARDRKLTNIHVHDLRQFTTDRHRTIDDYAYGGGSGMVLKPEPIFEGVRSIQAGYESGQLNRIILMSARGQSFTQEAAKSLTKTDNLLLICGHYKGVDERVIEGLDVEEWCIGDYVVTGGELPAMIVTDSVVRLIPGVLGDFESAVGDSFYDGFLDCPYYTRPETFDGMQVPDVLLSGHHGNIDTWRHEQSLKATAERRPDLLDKVTLTEKDKRIISSLESRKQELAGSNRSSEESDKPAEE